MAPLSTAGDGSELVGRVADSVRRTAVFIRDRRERPADEPDLFRAAEQALLLGHPLHPTPKGREGLSEAEARLYSPELRGSFPLHWMAVAPSVLAADSAWTERGRPVPAEQLTTRLAGTGLSLPEGYAALPLHPWQMREVRHRREAAALLDAGLLQDLGPQGSPWHATSSVRTVYRSGAPAMLKLSLGLRITNSRRENLRKELHRGVEVHRLLRSGLFKQWQAAHPGFDIVRDPAWLAVNGPDGSPLPGLDVMIRHNPFRPTDDAGCIAGLVSPRPHARPGARNLAKGRPLMRSRLTEIVTRLAGRTGRSRGAVATEWFLRYLEHVVRPVLWLDSEAGIALEAHQQNTLLLLDPEGWPKGGRYRDNQGYYFRESRRAELDARLPGIGRHSDTFVSDEVTDERFAYYLAINNVLGLVGAFGSQRLADEQLLLAAVRRFLADVATGPARLRTSLPTHLLDSPVLRCKANLLTRLHGLDELIGPVDTQSVYVTISNPLHS
jgi:siderophore synthetase component